MAKTGNDASSTFSDNLAGPRLHIATQAKVLLANWKYMLPVCAVAVLSYAFFCTHYSISIDDLSGDIYLAQGELLAQGRFTWVLFSNLFGFHDNIPYVEDAIGIVLLFISTVLFCALFNVVSDGTFGVVESVVFSAIFISSPLYTELFIYIATDVSIGGGYVLSICALYMLYKYPRLNGWGSVLAWLLAIGSLVLVVSWYESVVVVYVCAVFFILLLQSENCHPGNSSLLKDGLRYAFVLLVAIAIEFAVSNLLITLLGLTPSKMSANGLNLVTGTTVLPALSSWVYFYMVKGLFYSPIGIFDATLVVFLIVLVQNFRKYRSSFNLLLMLGMLLCTVALTLLQGGASPYRTAQIIPFFVACIWASECQYLQHEMKSIYAKRAFILLVGIVVALQVVDINHWFLVDWQRYSDEKTIVEEIGSDLQDIAPGEPVVFMGKFNLGNPWRSEAYVDASDIRVRTLERIHHFKYVDTTNTHCLKIQDVNVYEFITWSMGAGIPGGSGSGTLYRFFAFCGYDIAPGSKTMIADAESVSKNMPTWPQEGSIVNMGDYAIVNFGYTDMDSVRGTG